MVGILFSQMYALFQAFNSVLLIVSYFPLSLAVLHRSYATTLKNGAINLKIFIL
jgi:hypothetical protein